MSDLRAIAEARRERDGFLHQRSVEISAFEAQTEEEDARLWAQAQQSADVLWPEVTDAKVAAAWSSDRALAALDIRDALVDALNEHDAQDDLGYNSTCWCHQARAVLDKWDALG